MDGGKGGDFREESKASTVREIQIARSLNKFPFSAHSTRLRVWKGGSDPLSRFWAPVDSADDRKPGGVCIGPGILVHRSDLGLRTSVDPQIPYGKSSSSTTKEL